MDGRGDGAPRRFRLLFVCTGNLCRSPFARFHTRALLDMRLGPRWASWFDVASGGTGAVVGAEMHPMSRAQLGPLATHPDVAAFRARQLPARDVELADLVLTVSRSHRSAVLELEPRALRSTFTMREFARLLEGVDHTALPPDPRERAHALVAAALAERGQGAPVDPEDDAIPDPIQGGVEEHAEAARRIHGAVRPLVDAIGAAVPWPGRRPPPPRPAGPPGFGGPPGPFGAQRPPGPPGPPAGGSPPPPGARPPGVPPGAAPPGPRPAFGGGPVAPGNDGSVPPGAPVAPPGAPAAGPAGPAAPPYGAAVPSGRSTGRHGAPGGTMPGSAGPPPVMTSGPSVPGPVPPRRVNGPVPDAGHPAGDPAHDHDARDAGGRRIHAAHHAAHHPDHHAGEDVDDEAWDISDDPPPGRAQSGPSGPRAVSAHSTPRAGR